MADDETTLTAGIAYLFFFACWSRSASAWPVTTPGFTVVGLREECAGACGQRAREESAWPPLEVTRARPRTKSNQRG
jgi:hypothetical protein